MNPAFRFWQQTELRGDLPAKKFVMIVNQVRQVRPGTSLGAIADMINADWAEPDHDRWLAKTASCEIADWIIAAIP